MSVRIVVTVLGLCLGLAVFAGAKTQLAPTAVQNIDAEMLQGLLATFNQADQAIKEQDIDEVMAFYSDDYRFHNLKKADIRKIWMQLFTEYRDLESLHTFSVVWLTEAEGKLTAEMTCTGSLWGTSKTTSLRVPVDDWHEEVHRLRKQQGSWRIAGAIAEESPHTLLFGAAPHPLF